MKNRIKHLYKQFAFAITAVLIASLGNPALADDYVWDPGTNSWNVSTNWNNLDNFFEPLIDDGTIPDGSSDTATIVATPDPELFSNRSLGDLTLSANGDLLMNTFSLLLNPSGGTTGTVLVTGGGSTLSVEQGFLDTENLTLAASGILSLAGGRAQMDTNGSFGAGTFVSGFGDIEKGGTSDLFNDGKIAAIGGTLLIERNGGSSNFDWDGFIAAPSELEVGPGATLRITIPTGGDDYSELIDLNGGTFDVTNTWGMDSIANMDMNGNNTVSGASWDLGSSATINVNSGYNNINSTGFTTSSSGSIIVDPGATLDINTAGKVFNGSAPHTVNGILRLDNNTTFNGTGVIGTGTIDFNSGTATLTGTNVLYPILEINGTVNVGALSSFAPKNHINVNGGTLNMDNNTFSGNWELNKTLTATNSAQILTDDGYSIGSGQTWNILSGSDVTHAGNFVVGNAGTGTFAVSGAGSTAVFSSQLSISQFGATGVFNVTSFGNVTVNSSVALARSFSAAGMSGTLNINTGGDFTSENISLGDSDGSQGTGTINLNGVGSTLTQTGGSFLTVGNVDTPGNNGVHTINVANSGVFNTGTGIATIRKTGTVNVDTSGDFNVNGDLNITGGVVDLVTSGDFNWATGKTMSVTGGGRFTHEDSYFTPSNAIINMSGAGSLFDGVDPVGHNSTLTINDGTQLSVSSGGELAADYLFVNDGSTTIDGAGSNLDGTSGTIASFRHKIGSTSDTATLRLSNSATGSLASSTATRLEVGDSSNSTALLEVLSGADLTLQNLEINETGNGTSGIVNVDGSGSTITQVAASTLTIGDSAGGIAELNITNSGDYFTGTGLTTVNATGVVDVVDSGSVFNVNGDINVTGGTINSTGTGFNMAANKTLTASESGQFNITSGTHSLGGVRTYQITDGADMSLVNDFYIGAGALANATVIIDGVGSTLTTNTTGNNVGTFIGLNSGTGVLTVRNDAQATFTLGLLNIADSGNNLSNGTVNVESGGDLTANSIEMATNNVATAVLNVNGAGSTVTQTSGSLFEIGSGGTSSATVNVTNSGVINTDVGTTSLGANGVINVNTGGEINIGSGPGVLTSSRIEVSSGGTLNGNGTVNADLVYLSGGTVAPGLSIGTLTFNSSYQHQSGSTATLEIEINNTGVAGTDYDLLAVANNAFPRATLDLQLDGGYTPTLGDEFDFMTVGGLLFGTFDNITNVAQPGNLGLAVRYGFDPNQVDMRVTLSGDTDFDNDIDSLDINTAAGNFTGSAGLGKSWVNGDYDGDGDVDTLDINTAAGNWTGALAGAPGVPDIWYDPLTGNITVDTDGANVGGLTLLSASNSFIGPDVPDFSAFSFLLNDPDSNNQIGGALGPGFNGVTDLGDIAATGLTLADFAGSVWSSVPFGQVPVPEFFLGKFTPIPEPSSMLLLGMGLVGLAGRRRRTA